MTYIKDKSFWAIKPAATDSWNWRSILLLRSTAKVGEDGPRLLGIPTYATVASALTNHRRRLSSPRSAESMALYAHLSTHPIQLRSENRDYYIWVINGQRFQQFNTAKTWEALRPKTTQKEWARTVWFRGGTPKHSFTFWIAQLNRLPTRDRLMSWGLPTGNSCCLCSRFAETRDHLFLTCAYSEQIWTMIQSRLRLSPCIFYTWNAMLVWTNMKTASAPPPILRKLAAQATVYHIWKQRNNLLHNHIDIPPNILFKDIDKVMRNTITARRSRKQFLNLMVLWI